jgi:hypothetical protein
MSSARSTSDGRGPVTRKEFRIGRSQGNLARTPDVAVVIPLKLVFISSSSLLLVFHWESPTGFPPLGGLHSLLCSERESRERERERERERVVLY